MVSGGGALIEIEGATSYTDRAFRSWPTPATSPALSSRAFAKKSDRADEGPSIRTERAANEPAAEGAVYLLLTHYPTTGGLPPQAKGAKRMPLAAPPHSSHQYCRSSRDSRAFSLQLCTGKSSDVRLFLRKSCDGIGYFVYTRSKNTLSHGIAHRHATRNGARRSRTEVMLQYQGQCPS